MEYIPAWHPADLGMHYPGRVITVTPNILSLELDLSRINPGQDFSLDARLWVRRTVAPEVARRLRVDDHVTVVSTSALPMAHGYELWVSLPAEPSWLTWNNETVRRLARHIRQTGESQLLPILADALEDAGCNDATLLAHCREPQPPGSWAVELLATQQ